MLASEAAARVVVSVVSVVVLRQSLVEYLQTYLKEYPAARIITFVIKHLLVSYRLNEPYKGGIGSYAVVLMVVAYLKARVTCAVSHTEDRSLHSVIT